MKNLLPFFPERVILIESVGENTFSGKQYGRIAQPGERPPDAREVMGSSPLASIKKQIRFGSAFVLQLVKKLVLRRGF